MLRWLFLLVHRYLGLAAALVVIAVSLTGSALVVRDAVEGWVHSDVMRVEPGTKRISPDSALARVREAGVKRSPRLVEFPDGPRHPYAIWLNGSAQERVMVDPYRGTILGRNARTEGLMGTLFVWHTKLAAGAVGAWIVGLIGIGLLLLSITGLVIAWPGWGRLRRILLVKWTRGWRSVNYDLHRAGGIWTLAFVVLTAATGSGLFFYSSTGELLDWVTGTEPDNTGTPTSPPSSPTAERVSLVRAVDRARDALPGGTPTFVYLPNAVDAPITVRVRMGEEWHPNGRSFAYVDAYEGTLLRADNALEAPLGRRILYALYPLHIGSVGGVWGRILYVFLGLTPTGLAITGTIVWYMRRRDRSRQSAQTSLPETVRYPEAPPTGRSDSSIPRQNPQGRPKRK